MVTMLLRICLWCLCFVAPLGWAAAFEPTVEMLSNGQAYINLDGKKQMLRVGQTSRTGVTLISADNQQAVVKYKGKNYTLTLSRRISTGFKKAERAEIRIASGRGGHFVTPGLINGQQVEFMVDTGATAVAMNVRQAERLGINYLAGTKMTVNTANGPSEAYSIWLDSVVVGTVKVTHIEAFVNMSESPHVILLGNSYLSLVDMAVESGVLVLKAKH